MRPFSDLRRQRATRAADPADALLAQRRWAVAAYGVRLALLFGCAEVAVHWSLRLLARPLPVPPGALQAGADAVDALAAESSQLLGAPAVRQPAQAPGRLRLYGVIGGGRSAGAALIGVDGKPPRAFAVGASIEPGVRLVSTAFGRAEIEQQGRRVVLSSRPGEAAPALPGPAPVPAFQLAPPGVPEQVPPRPYTQAQ